MSYVGASYNNFRSSSSGLVETNLLKADQFSYLYSISSSQEIQNIQNKYICDEQDNLAVGDSGTNTRWSNRRPEEYTGSWKQRLDSRRFRAV